MHVLSPDAAHPDIVVQAELRSREYSHENRRRARDLAWRWVGTKWPRLMPTAAELEAGSLHRRVPGQTLSLSTSADGADWTLQVAHMEKGGQRSWTTRASVTDTGEADIVSLQTACSSLAVAPAVIAPPKLLGAWVERLDLEDGGVPVLAEPRSVADAEQLEGFCDHVMLQARKLPVIALTSKGDSRYYGVDPRGVSEAVRGLAHVVCLTPDLAAASRFGKHLAPLPGVPRIYAPGFSPTDSPKDHPLVRLHASREAEGEKDPGALRRLLARRVCAMSVEGSMLSAARTPPHP